MLLERKVACSKSCSQLILKQQPFKCTKIPTIFKLQKHPLKWTKNHHHIIIPALLWSMHVMQWISKEIRNTQSRRSNPITNRVRTSHQKILVSIPICYWRRRSRRSHPSAKTKTAKKWVVVLLLHLHLLLHHIVHHLNLNLNLNQCPWERVRKDI